MTAFFRATPSRIPTGDEPPLASSFLYLSLATLAACCFSGEGGSRCILVLEVRLRSDRRPSLAAGRRLESKRRSPAVHPARAFVSLTDLFSLPIAAGVALCFIICAGAFPSIHVPVREEISEGHFGCVWYYVASYMTPMFLASGVMVRSLTLYVLQVQQARAHLLLNSKDDRRAIAERQMEGEGDVDEAAVAAAGPATPPFAGAATAAAVAGVGALALPAGGAGIARPASDRGGVLTGVDAEDVATASACGTPNVAGTPVTGGVQAVVVAAPGVGVPSSSSSSLPLSTSVAAGNAAGAATATPGPVLQQQAHGPGWSGTAAPASSDEDSAASAAAEAAIQRPPNLSFKLKANEPHKNSVYAPPRIASTAAVTPSGAPGAVAATDVSGTIGTTTAAGAATPALEPNARRYSTDGSAASSSSSQYSGKGTTGTQYGANSRYAGGSTKGHSEQTSKWQTEATSASAVTGMSLGTPFLSYHRHSSSAAAAHANAHISAYNASSAASGAAAGTSSRAGDGGGGSPLPPSGLAATTAYSATTRNSTTAMTVGNTAYQHTGAGGGGAGQHYEPQTPLGPHGSALYPIQQMDSNAESDSGGDNDGSANIGTALDASDQQQKHHHQHLQQQSIPVTPIIPPSATASASPSVADATIGVVPRLLVNGGGENSLQHHQLRLSDSQRGGAGNADVSGREDADAAADEPPTPFLMGLEGRNGATGGGNANVAVVVSPGFGSSAGEVENDFEAHAHLHLRTYASMASPLGAHHGLGNPQPPAESSSSAADSSRISFASRILMRLGLGKNDGDIGHSTAAARNLAARSSRGSGSRFLDALKLNTTRGQIKALLLFAVPWMIALAFRLGLGHEEVFGDQFPWGRYGCRYEPVDLSLFVVICSVFVVFLLGIFIKSRQLGSQSDALGIQRELIVTLIIFMPLLTAFLLGKINSDFDTTMFNSDYFVTFGVFLQQIVLLWQPAIASLRPEWRPIQELTAMSKSRRVSGSNYSGSGSGHHTIDAQGYSNGEGGGSADGGYDRDGDGSGTGYAGSGAAMVAVNGGSATGDIIDRTAPHFGDDGAAAASSKRHLSGARRSIIVRSILRHTRTMLGLPPVEDGESDGRRHTSVSSADSGGATSITSTTTTTTQQTPKPLVPAVPVGPANAHGYQASNLQLAREFEARMYASQGPSSAPSIDLQKILRHIRIANMFRRGASVAPTQTSSSSSHHHRHHRSISSGGNSSGNGGAVSSPFRWSGSGNYSSGFGVGSSTGIPIHSGINSALESLAFAAAAVPALPDAYPPVPPAIRNADIRLVATRTYGASLGSIEVQVLAYHLIYTPLGRKHFKETLTREFALENMLFLLDALTFRQYIWAQIQKQRKQQRDRTRAAADAVAATARGRHSARGSVAAATGGGGAAPSPSHLHGGAAVVNSVASGGAEAGATAAAALGGDTAMFAHDSSGHGRSHARHHQPQHHHKNTAAAGGAGGGVAGGSGGSSLHFGPNAGGSGEMTGLAMILAPTAANTTTAAAKNNQRLAVPPPQQKQQQQLHDRDMMLMLSGPHASGSGLDLAMVNPNPAESGSLLFFKQTPAHEHDEHHIINLGQAHEHGAGAGDGALGTGGAASVILGNNDIAGDDGAIDDGSGVLRLGSRSDSSMLLNAHHQQQQQVSPSSARQQQFQQSSGASASVSGASRHNVRLQTGAAGAQSLPSPGALSMMSSTASAPSVTSSFGMSQLAGRNVSPSSAGYNYGGLHAGVVHGGGPAMGTHANNTSGTGQQDPTAVMVGTLLTPLLMGAPGSFSSPNSHHNGSQLSQLSQMSMIRGADTAGSGVVAGVAGGFNGVQGAGGGGGVGGGMGGASAWGVGVAAHSMVTSPGHVNQSYGAASTSGARNLAGGHSPATASATASPGGVNSLAHNSSDADSTTVGTVPTAAGGDGAEAVKTMHGDVVSRASLVSEGSSLQFFGAGTANGVLNNINSMAPSAAALTVGGHRVMGGQSAASLCASAAGATATSGSGGSSTYNYSRPTSFALTNFTNGGFSSANLINNASINNMSILGGINALNSASNGRSMAAFPAIEEHQHDSSENGPAEQAQQQHQHQQQQQRDTDDVVDAVAAGLPSVGLSISGRFGASASFTAATTSAAAGGAGVAHPEVLAEGSDAADGGSGATPGPVRANSGDYPPSVLAHTHVASGLDENDADSRPAADIDAVTAVAADHVVAGIGESTSAASPRVNGGVMEGNGSSSSGSLDGARAEASRNGDGNGSPAPAANASADGASLPHPSLRSPSAGAPNAPSVTAAPGSGSGNPMSVVMRSDTGGTDARTASEHARTSKTIEGSDLHIPGTLLMHQHHSGSGITASGSSSYRDELTRTNDSGNGNVGGGGVGGGAGAGRKHGSASVTISGFPSPSVAAAGSATAYATTASAQSLPELAALVASGLPLVITPAGRSASSSTAVAMAAQGDVSALASPPSFLVGTTATAAPGSTAHAAGAQQQQGIGQRPVNYAHAPIIVTAQQLLAMGISPSQLHGLLASQSLPSASPAGDAAPHGQHNANAPSSTSSDGLLLPLPSSLQQQHLHQLLPHGYANIVVSAPESANGSIENYAVYAGSLPANGIAVQGYWATGTGTAGVVGGISTAAFAQYSDGYTGQHPLQQHRAFSVQAAGQDGGASAAAAAAAGRGNGAGDIADQRGSSDSSATAVVSLPGAVMSAHDDHDLHSGPSTSDKSGWDGRSSATGAGGTAAGAIVGNGGDGSAAAGAVAAPTKRSVTILAPSSDVGVSASPPPHSSPDSQRDRVSSDRNSTGGVPDTHAHGHQQRHASPHHGHHHSHGHHHHHHHHHHSGSTSNRESESDQKRELDAVLRDIDKSAVTAARYAKGLVTRYISGEGEFAVNISAGAAAGVLDRVRQGRKEAKAGVATTAMAAIQASRLSSTNRPVSPFTAATLNVDRVGLGAPGQAISLDLFWEAELEVLSLLSRGPVLRFHANPKAWEAWTKDLRASLRQQDKKPAATASAAAGGGAGRPSPAPSPGARTAHHAHRHLQ